MANALTACRIATVRRSLREPRSDAEFLLALGALAELACELRDDDLGGTGAARARRLLGEAIGYLRAASAVLPPGHREHRQVLYWLGRACLRRNDTEGLIPDIDDGIECLRRLRTALADSAAGGSADEADRLEVEALLSEALMARAFGSEVRAVDVDEALPLMTSVQAALPPGHPARRQVTAALAVAHVGRYLGLGGPVPDRDAAEAHAAAALADPGPAVGAAEADESAAMAHIVLAWTALTREYTPEQRSVMLKQTEIEAARSGAISPDGLVAALGMPQISAAAAETAIGHLRQVPPGASHPFVRSSVPTLWAFAQLAQMYIGVEATDVGPVAEQLVSLAGDPETPEIERSELLAFRAALLAGQSNEAAADALGDAVSGLPIGHLLRSPMLRALRALLSGQVDPADSADGLSARLDEVTAVLGRLPHDDPEAAHAMTQLTLDILNAATSNRTILQRDELFAQLERLASDLPPDDPLAPVAELMVWSGRYVRARVEHEPESAEAALGELIRRADLVPAGHVLRPFTLYAVATAHLERHSIDGEQRSLELADQVINEALAEAALGGPFAERTAAHGYLIYLRGHLKARRAVYRPSLPVVNEAIDDLEQAAAELGPAESSRMGVMTALGTARVLRERLTIPVGPEMPLGPAASEALDRQLAEAERAGPNSLTYPVLVSQAAAGLMMRALGSNDVTQADRAAALMAGACAIPTLGLRERPRMLQLHGHTLLTRYLLTRDARDLNNAIARLAEARRAVDQEPGSPYRADVLQSLASAYRYRGNQARGDVDHAVEIGLEGLRERAGNVLLQDSDDNALDVAREATNDAGEMARWFLGRGREEAAVSAIELGRGIVLHTATSGTGIADALSQAGHPELASEWKAQGTRPGSLRPEDGNAPAQDDDLRFRAMLALAGTPAEARLLSPPTVTDIAAALAGSGADELVYLLPHNEDGYGIAVLVDRAGTVGSLLLPRLRVGNGGPVGEFLRARRAAERAEQAAAEAAGAPRGDTAAARVAFRAARAAAAAASQSAQADWVKALDAVCDWAWQAAVGPLLRTLAKRAGDRSQGESGYPPRIVLVPGGELGLIPWHAARHPAAGRSAAEGAPTPYDYACRHAVISYASSARQFIDAARRPVRPWSQSPTLISDAVASSTYAVAVVAHLFAAHYANGAVFGSARYQVAGSGTPGAVAAGPADVLLALPHGDHPGSSLLYFGCHGRVSVPVLGSNLLLAADPGGGDVIVSVADILRQARAGQGQAAGGGLVILASCLTDVTEADYDEALSLATAFLAAGSAGVVAARWSVPDAGTALFMAAFQQFLNQGQPDPARALRQAQLWMLNPDREVPASWPQVLREEAGLDGRPDGPNLTSAATWAGFTYQGR